MSSAEQAYFSTKTATPNTTVDFNGRWSNELGSHMDLTVSTDGKVTGTYVSARSEAGGPTPPMPLLGAVAGDLIFFCVNWGDSITSWVGHGVLESGQPRILTLWHMALAIPDETDPLNQWETIMAGADSFIPGR